MFDKISIDGKTALGGVVIAGYMLLVNKMVGMPQEIPNAELVKDQMLVLGPAIGMIVGALWRNTVADERRTAHIVNAEIERTRIHEAAAPLALPSPDPQLSLPTDDENDAELIDGMYRRADGRAGWRDEMPIQSPAIDLPESNDETEIMK